MHPAKRLARTAEIAWAILFLLSPLASYVNDIRLNVDQGLDRDSMTAAALRVRSEQALARFR